MEPLICPQCGGRITSYSPGQTFTTCQYCSTSFLIEANKQKDADPVSVYTPDPKRNPQQTIISVIVAAFLVIGGAIFFAVVSSTKTTRPKSPPITSFTPRPSTSPVASTTSTPDPDLLGFGGKGTGNGLFQDPDSIAVDKQGRIYVGDGSLRVQQFDEKGEFLRVWQVPAKTSLYSRARQINKIAVADNGNLYVAVGGVILVYAGDATEPTRTIHVAPDYIQDFAFRSDGGLLAVSNNDSIETLVYFNQAGKVTRRIKGFHTNTADAALSPAETGVVAIRIAVDGAGNIFSVYAFGDLGSYQLSYNTEELMIFRFTPEGKYVNKFVETMSSCGIEVDDQSRIYLTDGQDVLNVYSNTGQLIGSVWGVGATPAFALDKANNVYAIKDDKVIKRPAIS